MADREIKIRFVVDEAAARKASLLISDLTRAVDKLVQVSSRVGPAMGGVAGGANVGSVNVRSGRGPIGGAPFTAAGGGKSQGGIVANVLGIQDTASLSKLISGTQQGFQSIASSIKTFTDKSINDIQRLNRAVAGLNATMGAGRFEGRPSLDARGLPPIPPLDPRNPAMADMSGQARIVHQTGRLSPMGERANNAANAVQSLMRGDIRGFLGNGLGFGAASAGAGAFMTGIYASEKLNSALVDERVARINQTVNQPFDVLGRRSQMAAPFLRMHGAINSRDVNYQRAFMDTIRDPQIMESLGKTGLRAESVERQMLRTGTLKGEIKEAWNSFRNWASEKAGGVTTDDYFRFINNIPDTPDNLVVKKTMRDIARENAIANMDPAAAAQFQQAVEAKRSMQDPTTALMMGNVYGGAMSRVRTMRAMGMGTSIVRRRGANGEYQTSLYEDMEQRLNRGGWDQGDYAAGRQQLLQIGLGYGRAVGPIGLVSAGIGGLGNAAQLVQAGGAMGGNVAAGRAMLGAVQASIGRNALDVAAGRDLFGNMVQQAAASGQWVGSRAAMQYAGMTAGLIGGGSAVPYDVGGQQMMAGLVGAGMPAFGRFTQGTEAPLYKATSLMGAVGATGGYSMGAEALTRMDPGLLSTIARGGDVPPWAKALGIDQGTAAKYLKYQRQAPLFELMDELVPGQAGQTLAGVRAGGGDFVDYINGQVGPQGRRETAKQFQRRRAGVAMNVANDLGAAMFASGTVGSPAEGAGIFLGQLGQDKDFAPFLRGGGVGAASPKGVEKDALAREADLVKEHGKVVTQLQAIVKAMAPATDLERQSATTVDAIAKGAGGAGLPGAIGGVIAALEIFKNRIEASEKPQRRVR